MAAPAQTVPPTSATPIKKSFLENIASFISDYKFYIAIVAVIAGVVIYYYCFRSPCANTDLQVLNNDFQFPDEPNQPPPQLPVRPTSAAPTSAAARPASLKVQEIEDDLSVSSLDTIVIGENESKIISMEDSDLSVKSDQQEQPPQEQEQEGFIENEDEDAHSHAEPQNVYMRGPKKGQAKQTKPKKEKTQKVRRRKKAI